MKLTNSQKIKLFDNFFNALVLLIIAFIGLMHFNLLPIDIIFNKYDFAILLLIALSYVAINGWYYYEFDTSGEGITLGVNRIDALSFLGKKQRKIDLPKYKLSDYQIKKGILYDKLTLFIHSRKSNQVKVKFKFMALTKDERSLIINELDKIIIANQN